MDPQVRALVRRAEQQLADLSRTVDELGAWEDDVGALRSLEAVASTLVDATRRHAEDLSCRAADRRRGPAVSG